MRGKTTLIIGLGGGLFLIAAFWIFMSLKMVGEDEVLVVVRRYFGQPMPAHKTVADDGEKGPRRVALGTGFHFVPAWINRAERYPITRIPTNMVGVLIARSGRDPEAGTIIVAPDEYEKREDGSRGALIKEGEKGIREELLPEGEHRVNPYEFDVELHKWVTVPKGSVGVLIQLTGDPLPEGEIIAQAEAGDLKSGALPRSKHRGVLEPVLPPGSYKVHPYMYRVEIHDEVRIDAGFLGAQLRKVGAMPKGDGPLVEAGERGIQQEALKPGRHYLNPYVFEVVPISIRMQKFEVKKSPGKPAGIEFPSLDAFSITADITLQWKIPPDNVPLVFATLGDIARIEEILIEPHCHSVARLKGSNHTAKKFISGETRKQFENDVQAELETILADRGLLLDSALVRNIIIPPEIETPIQDARVAIEERAQYEEQTKEAESEAARQKEKKLAEQRKAMVEADTAQIAIVNEAKKKQKTEVIAAERKLEVATVLLEAAKQQAEALLKRKRAEANVLLFGFQAEAAGYQAEVAALGEGELLARLELWQKIAPAIQAVIPMGEGTLWTGGELFDSILKIKGVQALTQENAGSTPPPAAVPRRLPAPPVRSSASPRSASTPSPVGPPAPK